MEGGGMTYTDDEIAAEARHMEEEARAESCHGWPDAVPLPEGLSRVESFEPELLPDAIAPWVMDIAERMQCPPDYIATAASRPRRRPRPQDWDPAATAN
jgi:hypothetical protein